MLSLFKLYRLIKTNAKYISYIQGQAPEPRIREYFYYIDHQGMLFLDDVKIKNFTSCFKDKVFLEFFFKRIQINNSERYQDDFPYISLCGRERNFIRCDDRPIVFIQMKERNEKDILIYAYPDSQLFVDFQPQHLFMHPKTLRLYHPAPQLPSGIGLIKSSLAMDLSNNFIWDTGKSEHELPLFFNWKGFKHKLTHSLLNIFSEEPERLKGLHGREI